MCLLTTDKGGETAIGEQQQRHDNPHAATSCRYTVPTTLLYSLQDD